MVKRQPWVVRFVDITKFLSVECAFVFIGEDAEKARAIKWPESHRHYAGPRTIGEGDAKKLLESTMKFYLFGGTASEGSERVSFRVSELEMQADKLGIREAFIHWTFMRKNSRIAAARVSEGVTWGFGRPHPRKPDFKGHQDLAGPLVDYQPGMKDGWVFEPVLLKIRPDTLRAPVHVLELSPKWDEGKALMVALKVLDSQVPAFLAEYQFNGTDRHEEFDRELLTSLAEQSKTWRRG
ncbi:MAG: hypothetical protein Q7S66_06160 [bacterium]|nr:hypothetical protein [bacterium]